MSNISLRSGSRCAVWLCLLAVGGCGAVDPTEDGELGTTTQAVLDCGDGTHSTFPCYVDADHDGRGSGPAAALCHCGTNGTSTNDNDCDDGNASRFQRLSCYTDADGDGVGAGAAAMTCTGATCTAGWTTKVGLWADDAQTIPNNTDCNDGNAGVYQDLTCYPDADGDNYGAGTATTVCAGLTCADGVTAKAESAGDCNDGNSAIHPHRLEVSGNDVDDNCTGEPDEARSVFSAAGNGNTDSSFTIQVQLESAADLAAATTTGLKAKIHYRKLENASSPYIVTAALPMTIQNYFGVYYYASVTLTGLEELKVYEARLDFYQVPGGTTRITPASGCTGTSASATPCSNSDVYYTITRPTGVNVPVKTARYNIVLNALSEYYHFRTNPMGSWDNSLRDRFDLTHRTQLYCSEFYATSAKPFLKDMNACTYAGAATPGCDPAETSTAEDYVGDVRNWFAAYASSVSDYNGEADMLAAKPGDYLGVRPTAEHVDGQHSEMFLAWDAAAKRYWFVEGNGTYSNAWGQLGHTVNVKSDDTCNTAGTYYCPANAALECSSGCYSVKTIGSVNNSNMLD